MASRKEEGTKKFLIIVTNAGEYEKVGMRTGLWLGEANALLGCCRIGWIFNGYRGAQLGGRIPLDSRAWPMKSWQKWELKNVIEIGDLWIFLRIPRRLQI